MKGNGIADESIVAVIVDSTDIIKTLNLVEGEEAYALFNHCIGDVFDDELRIFRHADD